MAHAKTPSPGGGGGEKSTIIIRAALPLPVNQAVRAGKTLFRQDRRGTGNLGFGFLLDMLEGAEEIHCIR
ncbi:hypothetical protein PPNSA23_08200 [Phyllobacterium phragmitis]|uniref:Uncharacterized protein n=1 Tax=Phyllobacterium phragmitis TaxID=2670329 RepID=A0ABQ0GW37_9HYPH